MWRCSNCEREFQKTNQTHSCRYYPIENHFKGKEAVGKPLFEYYKKQIEDQIGPVKVESLPCCIHLLSSQAFGAAWIQKDKIKIDFRLNKKVEDPRFLKQYEVSKNRHMYYLEIKTADEIDAKLIGWLKEAYVLSV